MAACCLCKTPGENFREESIFTLKRTGVSTMIDGSVTLADIKEHRFALCAACIKRNRRLMILVGIIMLAFFITGFIVMLSLSPDENDLWFVGLAAVVLSVVFGFLALTKLSDVGKLKKLALKERNLPGYTAMSKGEYDAFSKAAKWNRGELD